MQLLEISLRNWGPFFGDHTVSLSVDEAAPVVIFRGENMRGKTSFLRAIVWCLYGQIREQDGRTVLALERMVNLDAMQGGEVEFGVKLRFSHNGAEYVLHRTATASDESGRTVIRRPTTDLMPSSGLPFPAASIPEVIDGILSHDISDFYFFDGEMLNRFEERLREDRANSQSFVRGQVERALGLPFMRSLEADLEVIQGAVTASMDLAVKKEKKQNALSLKLAQDTDSLRSVEKSLADLRERDEVLLNEISELDAQLSKVDEIKDLYFERKNLEAEAANASDTMDDMRAQMAELAETNWWLPAADLLYGELSSAESAVLEAESADQERYKLNFQIEQLTAQIGTGICSACHQPVTNHDSGHLEAERESVRQSLEKMPVLDLSEARVRRDRLRAFSSAQARLERAQEQEQDLGRERLRNDKRLQRIRQISEQISDNTVDIESLERNLIDRKTMRSRTTSAIKDLEEKQRLLKDGIASLGKQLADQPEVNEVERRLQRAVQEGLTTVQASYDKFRAVMRDQVAAATSDLFRRLTTEKEYSGVRISEDYMLSVVDHQGRSLGMISAGANQILTTAFIGALAECSVDEAPMVMDTPFGRLDVGHRSAILDWVSTFETQVILFVQSGEYDPKRDVHLLAGKIGREYTIERLSPTRSEVRAA